MASDLDHAKRSVIWRLNSAMKKLPMRSIKAQASIGECDLWNTYFDPILSNILADPEKNVSLRWANVECDGTMNKRPDATISTIRQFEFGKSLRFGEVKPSEPTCNKFALCHDLLRLAVFCKDSLDINQLKASLSFQIHGFKITFFLTRLRHDGLYIKQEIGDLTFPRSVDELPTFINMKTLRTLLQVTGVFWRLCKKDEQWQTTWLRPTYPNIYEVLDASMNRKRRCATRFGQE